MSEESSGHHISHLADLFDEHFDPSVLGGFFLSWDSSEPPQLWVWRGVPDESAEPWVFVAHYHDTNESKRHGGST